MKVDLFDFALPRSLIAAHPAVPRDAARLLVVDEALEDRVIAELPGLLDPGDLLVLNQTRVIPARLKGTLAQPANASVEVTLHRKMGADCWDGFAKPARKLKPGREIRFAEDFAATVEARAEGGEVRLRFSLADGALSEALSRYGTTPLPPYIPRPDGPEARDREDYQTGVRRRRRAPSPRRRPGCISPSGCSTASRRAGSARLDHAACRRRHVFARQGGGHQGSPDA